MAEEGRLRNSGGIVRLGGAGAAELAEGLVDDRARYVFASAAAHPDRDNRLYVTQRRRTA
jgi:hypothetical protein